MTVDSQELQSDLPPRFQARPGAEASRAPLGALAVFGAYVLLMIVSAWGAPRPLLAHLSLDGFGRALAVTGAVRFAQSRALLLAMIVPAVFCVELALVGWADSSLRRSFVRCTPSSLSDLTCFLFNETPLLKAVGVVVSLGAVLASDRWLHGLLVRGTGLNPSLGWAPPPLRYGIYFLAYSFFDYWGHRLDHHRWFWPLHRFHHAPDEFCILTAERLHPAGFTNIIHQALPAALVGATPEVVVEVSLFAKALNLVIHSRIRSDFGWVGRYLLQSPAHHRAHHSLEAGAAAGHYGLVPIWDHLFGTWRGKADLNEPIGVRASYRQGAWPFADMWRDYCEFWGGIARRLNWG